MEGAGGRRREEGEERVSSEVPHLVGLSSHHRRGSQVRLVAVSHVRQSPCMIASLAFKALYLGTSEGLTCT